MHSPKLKIWLIGAPASGKTTLRSRIRDWCVERLGGDLLVTGIEEMHRTLFPPGQEDGSYFYDANSALVLLNRSRQIPQALSLLKTQCESALAENGFVAELAHRSLGRALITMGARLINSALIIQLWAPKLVRLQRNELREATRIPARVVEEYPEFISEKHRAYLEEEGARITEVDASESIESTSKALVALLEEYWVRTVGGHNIR